MNKTPRQPRKVLNLRPLIGGGLLALFVFVLAVAQFRTLHESCHAEADQSDHQCVFTLVQAGLVDAPPVVATVEPPVTVLVSEPFPVTSFVSSVDYSLLPSRGPPALLT